jgi:putative addiction module CopG family antidote
MTISISGELDAMLQQELATGQYNSKDEVLLAAVRLLRDRSSRLAALRQEIQPALERLDRGEGEPLDMAAVKAEARRTYEQAKSSSNKH